MYMEKVHHAEMIVRERGLERREGFKWYNTNPCSLIQRKTSNIEKWQVGVFLTPG